MKQPDNIHLDSIIEEMQIFEEMGGVRDLEDYQDIMRYLVKECSTRLENSKVNDPDPYDYIKNINTESTGGGCTIDIITLKDGKILTLNDEVLILHESEAELQSCFEGETEANKVILL